MYFVRCGWPDTRLACVCLTASFKATHLVQRCCVRSSPTWSSVKRSSDVLLRIGSLVGGFITRAARPALESYGILLQNRGTLVWLCLLGGGLRA